MTLSTNLTLATLHEVARELRLSREWLRREAKTGRVPHLRAGRKLLFEISTVRAVLAERAAKGEGVTCGN